MNDPNGNHNAAVPAPQQDLPASPLRRLILGLAFLSVVAISLSRFQLAQTRAQLLHQGQTESKALAGLLQQTIGSMIKKTDLTLLNVADEVLHQSGEGKVRPALLGRFIEQQFQRMPELDALRVTDSRGRVTAGSGLVSTVPVSMADREYFIYLRDHPAAGLVISKPLVGKINGKWSIICARRITLADGTFGGVALGAVTLQKFSELFRNVPVGTRGAIGLRRDDLTPIIHYVPTVEQKNAARTGPTPIAEEWRTLLDQGVSQAGSFTADSLTDGVRRLYSYSRISPYPLYVDVGLALDEVLADYYREQRMVMAIVGMFLFMAGLLIWQVQRNRVKTVASFASLARIVELESNLRTEQGHLLENRALLRDIIDNIPSLIYATDVSGRFTVVNRPLATLFGQTPEQVVGRSRADFLPMEIVDEHLANELKVFKTGISGQFEERNEEQDGTHLYLSSKVPLRNVRGEIIGVCGISTDISARKRHEGERERLLAMLEATRNELYVFDTETLQFSYVNHSALENIGYTMEQLYGMTPLDLKTEMGHERFRGLTELLLSGDKTLVRFEAVHRRADGTTYPVEVHLQLVEGSYNSIRCFLAVIHDITERRQMETYGELSREILQILNKPGDIQDSINRVLEVLKKTTGFDAVGIRLQAGQDFPYFVQEGFPRDFLLAENTLIEHSDDGGVCRDKDGNVSLECTCGLVISGRTDSANPFFTSGGSFWTNDSFPLLDLPPEMDPRNHPRNLCIHEGYASVALVPIRNKGSIVGLVQFNDKRKGCFTHYLLELLEGIASHIGEALMRKRAEEELLKKDAEIEEQNAELRSSSFFIENLVMQSAAPIFVLDNRHRILFWNRALAKLTGLASEQMTGTDRHWEAFYPERRATLADLVLDNAEEMVPSLYDSYYKSRLIEGALNSSGWFHFPAGKRFLSFHAAPIYDDGGDIVAVVETLEDNTATKQIENVLNEQYRFLQQVLDSLPNPVYYKNRNGAYIGCNRSFEEFFGKDRQFIMGKYISDLIPVEVARDHISIDKECMKSDSVQTFETSLLRADGFTRQLISTKAPLHLGSGKVSGLVGTFTDITERKQIENSLRESEEKFRAISDSAQDAVIMIDNSGLVSFWNAAAEQIFGYAKDEILGRDLHEHIAPPAMQKMFRTAFAVFLENGQGTAVGKTLELPAVRKGGTTIPIELSLSAVHFGGKWCAIGLARDITTRMEALKAIADAQAALEAKHAELISTQSRVVQQEKLASIGQMAAGVAHEINNPMAFISCNLNSLGKYIARLREYQSALSTYLEDCPESLRQAIDGVQRRLKIDYILEDTGNLVDESLEGAERVRKIVQDLKGFSRVDEADEKLADIIQCLESTINIAWSEIKNAAALRKEFGDIPQIKCFPQQLNQVFMNLLVNAAQAISGYGEIIVRTWNDAENVFVSVCDNGSGIPEDVQQRIFEPFFTTKESGKGTGLGLSISYDIVKKHGGDLMLVSQPGQGTTFTVRLPINNIP